MAAEPAPRAPPPAPPLAGCRVLPLEGVVEAHQYAEQGHVRGKLGIAIKQLD